MVVADHLYHVSQHSLQRKENGYITIFTSDLSSPYEFCVLGLTCSLHRMFSSRTSYFPQLLTPVSSFADKSFDWYEHCEAVTNQRMPNVHFLMFARCHAVVMSHGVSCANPFPKE